MTKKTPKQSDLVLSSWKEGASDKLLRSKFEDRNSWVVGSPKSAALWYWSVLNNLTCRYIMSQPQSTSQIREILSSGLERIAFDRLKQVTNASREELGNVVRIPARTIARRKKFKPDESERILRVASAFQKSLEVLGNLEDARHWFNSPKRALGERTPLEFCDTGPGAEEVENLLGRIEHGVFS